MWPPLTDRSNAENPRLTLTSIWASWQSKSRRLLTWPYSAVMCNDVLIEKLRQLVSFKIYLSCQIYPVFSSRPTRDVGISLKKTPVEWIHTFYFFIFLF
jgi:hypothetical protein